MKYALFSVPVGTIYDLPQPIKEGETGPVSTIGDEGLYGQACQVRTAPGGVTAAGVHLAPDVAEVVSFYGYHGYVFTRELQLIEEAPLRDYLAEPMVLAGRATDVLNLPKVQGVRMMELERGGLLRRVAEAPEEAEAHKGWAKVRLVDGRVGYVRDVALEPVRYEMSAVFSQEEGLPFDEALAKATELGYAEADPTADIEGYDAGRKVAIMASIAFRSRVVFSDVYTEGITKISARDILYAKEFGCVIKLVGRARNTRGGIEAAVYPMMIPEDHPLASVRDSFNAVFLHGDAVDDVMFYGRGAGEFPTASAVMGDVIDVMRDIRYNCTGRISCTCYRDTPVKPFAEAENQFVLRMKVENRPGVLASIAGVLGAHQVSISKVVQKIITDGAAELVIVTDAVKEMAFGNALEDLKELEITREIGNVIREY